MKFSIPKIKAQFVIDSHGKKRQIIMSVQDFEKLLGKMEDLHDVAAAEATKRKSKKRYSLEFVEKEIFGQSHGARK